MVLFYVKKKQLYTLFLYDKLVSPFHTLKSYKLQKTEYNVTYQESSSVAQVKFVHDCLQIPETP